MGERTGRALLSEVVMRYLIFSLLLLAALGWAETPGLDLLTAADSPLRSGDRLLFVGDSITAAAEGRDGFVTLVRNTLAKHPELNVTVLSSGVPGMKATGYAGWRTAVALRPWMPSVVFYYIGVNDVWHREQRFGGKGTDPLEYETALRKTIGAVQEGGAVVVLATPAVIGEKIDGTNDLRAAMPNIPSKDADPMPADAPLEQYCTISRKVAAEMDVELCDLRAAFLTELKASNPENKVMGILTTDGVHLNAAGNALVAREAAASIVRALRRPSSWLFIPPPDPTLGNAITFADTELYQPKRQECRLAPYALTILTRVPLTVSFFPHGDPQDAQMIRYVRPYELPAHDGKPTLYPVRVRGVDDAGHEVRLALDLTLLPPLPAVGVPSGTVPGLTCEVFAPGSDTATRTRVDGLSLKAETRPTGTRTRFSGWLEVPTTGIYLVRTQARDQFTVTLDETWRHSQIGPSWTSRAIGLAAGRHRIALEYTGTGNPEPFLNFLIMQGHIEQGTHVSLGFMTLP
jgi:lysophospholipase L1-like esterase